MKKEDILKRLRQAADADPKGLKAGRAFGRKWAEETANPRQLRLVASLIHYEAEQDEDEPPVAHGSALSSRVAWMVADLEPDDEEDGECEAEAARKIDQRWNMAKAALKSLGKEGLYLADYEEFAIGFIKGANDVLTEVEGEI